MATFYGYGKEILYYANSIDIKLDEEILKEVDDIHLLDPNPCV